MMAGVLLVIGCGAVLGVLLAAAFGAAVMYGIWPVDSLIDSDSIHPF